MITEATLQRQCLAYLKGLANCYFFKASDRFTSGIPDIVGCYNGLFFGVELKRPGEKPRQLQYYVLDKIKKSGGYSTWVDNLSDFKLFFSDLDKLLESVNK